MSGHEHGVALLLAWDDEVLDIQDQYPLLPVSRTQELAASRGIYHPMENGFPIERTLDFRCRHARLGCIATSVKPSSKVDGDEAKCRAAHQRVLDLLELERAFAEAEGWPWALVTECDIPAQRVANLAVLNQKWAINLPDVASDRVEAMADAVMRLMERGWLLAEACGRVDLRMGLPETGSALSVALHFVARKAWSVDLDAPLDPRAMRPRLGSPPDTAWVSKLTFL